MMRKVISFLALLTFLSSAWAREPVDMSMNVSTANKQEAFDQATEEATRRMTEDLLGREQAEKQWPQLKGKILKNSGRYVLYIKGSPPQDEQGQPKMQVQLRIAPEVLETVLRESGAMAGGTVRVLPMLQMSDGQGADYSWWASETEDRKTNQAQEYFKRVFKQLSAQFKAKNVFVLDPTVASFRMGIPATYRTTSLRREDQAYLAQYLKADIVLTGRVNLVRPRSDSSELRADYELQLWQTRSGRALAEVFRSETLATDQPKVVGQMLEKSSPKIFGEMAGKLAEAMAAGSLNLGLVRLQVAGDLNYRQQTEFKKLLSAVRDVRVLRERLFEPSRVTFEAETSVTGSELAKYIQSMSFPAFSVRVDNVQDDSLVLNVRAQ